MGKDPLLEREGVDRLYFATGVMLDKDDLKEEQTYHRGRLARALAYLNGVGTVAGLEVRGARAREDGRHEVIDASETANGVLQVAVEPGLALDALGRLVEVPQRMCVDLSDWLARERRGNDASPPEDFSLRDDLALTPPGQRGVVADVLLRAAEFERGRTQAFAASDLSGVDAVTPARVRDGFELALVRRREVPLPQGPSSLRWRPGGAATERDFQRWVFDAWKGARARENGRADELQRLRSLQGALVPPEMDPDWVFLARVFVGVGSGEGGTAPNGRVRIDNSLRAFAVTAAALAQWLRVTT